jgi:hypothetical protein
VLTIGPDGDLGGGSSSLPVFSFREEAESFLGLSKNDDREERRSWRVRETTAGELVSVLLAPCANVRQVALDSLPLSLGGAASMMLPLWGVARERFVAETAHGKGQEGSRRRASACVGWITSIHELPRETV